MNHANKFELEIPAHKICQPIGEFFVASIDAQDLVDISYSDVRRMEGERDVERYLGIQRPLKKSRIKEIRSYILNNRDATFPTSVILAVDEKCVEYNEKTKALKLYPYIPEEGSENSPIPKHKIAKVLDGQHRIAGFFDGDGENRAFDFDREFKISVSIFVGIDLPEQAKIFATVNLAQTKVNKSLVYDLEELAKKRNPFKTCHHVAVALDANESSPFFERIKRLGVATPGREYEPLTQASFVEALVKFISDDPTRDRNDILDRRKMRILDSSKYPFRNYFLAGEEGDLRIYKIIFNYFSAVREKWPTAWENKDIRGNLLPKSNAFKALMKYLKNDILLEFDLGKSNSIPSTIDFIPYFKHVALNDNDFNTRNFAPGSGGQSMFYKVLKGEIDANELFD